MSVIHDSAPPAFRAAGVRKGRDPKSILAAICRMFDARRERHRLDPGPTVYGYGPIVPTFFAVDVLDLIGDRHGGRCRNGRLD